MYLVKQFSYYGILKLWEYLVHVILGLFSLIWNSPLQNNIYEGTIKHYMTRYITVLSLITWALIKLHFIYAASVCHEQK